MPFRTLGDPADVARAFSAFEALWHDLKRSIATPDHDRERIQIAYLVAEFAPLALDEEDLTRIVKLHYRPPVAADALTVAAWSP